MNKKNEEEKFPCDKCGYVDCVCTKGDQSQ